jgi:hypothetical protein
VRQHRLSANALIRLVLLHIVLQQERSKDRDYSAALGGMVCGIAIAAYIHLAGGWTLVSRPQVATSGRRSFCVALSTLVLMLCACIA